MEVPRSLFRAFLALDFQQRDRNPRLSSLPLISLASPSGTPLGSHVSSVTHGRLFPKRRCSRVYVSPRTLFTLLYVRSATRSSTTTTTTNPPSSPRLNPCVLLRSCVTSTATAGTISSLNATSPRYMFILSSVTMEYVARAMPPVRFDHLHPFILRRIAVLSTRF